MARVKYPEGTAFLVPLRNGGFARGVVARVNPRAACIFGYFFGPKHNEPSTVDLNGLDPQMAIASMRFGDLGIIKGEWKILGHIQEWNRDCWKMPDFIRREPIANRAWLVRYSDCDPARVEGEAPVPLDTDLPEDSSWGCGAVELYLTQVLE